MISVRNRNMFFKLFHVDHKVNLSADRKNGFPKILNGAQYKNSCTLLYGCLQKLGYWQTTLTPSNSRSGV